jgi:hypothetical protein
MSSPAGGNCASWPPPDAIAAPPPRFTDQYTGRPMASYGGKSTSPDAITHCLA